MNQDIEIIKVTCSMERNLHHKEDAELHRKVLSTSGKTAVLFIRAIERGGDYKVAFHFTVNNPKTLPAYNEEGSEERYNGFKDYSDEELIKMMCEWEAK